MTTKFRTIATLGLTGLLLATPVVWSQPPAEAAAAYVNENQPDPAPLKLRNLEGSVRGLGGDPMPGASVLLFTEEGHDPVASVPSDREGKFRFNKVSKGLYRIVVKVPGLCPANIPVVLEGSLLAHHKVVVTMRPKDIDTCSYAMAK